MGVKVNLVQSDLRDGYDEVIEMDVIPRIGERICFDIDNGPYMEVRDVIWIIGNPDYSVRIKYR